MTNEEKTELGTTVREAIAEAMRDEKSSTAPMLEAIYKRLDSIDTRTASVEAMSGAALDSLSALREFIASQSNHFAALQIGVAEVKQRVERLTRDMVGSKGSQLKRQAEIERRLSALEGDA